MGLIKHSLLTVSALFHIEFMLGVVPTSKIYSIPTLRVYRFFINVIGLRSFVKYMWHFILRVISWG